MKDDQPLKAGFALAIDTEYTVAPEETLYAVGVLETETQDHRLFLRRIDLSKFPAVEEATYDADVSSYAD